MVDVDVLRITTAVDLAPLKAGMAGMTSIVQAETAKMSANFKQLQTSGLWVPPGIAADLNSVSAAASSTGEQIASAARRGGSQMTEARHAIRGLGEEIGIHMPRFVSSFLTSVGPVSTIMAAAFAPIAVIGMVEVLSQIPDAIAKGIDALRGWGEEAKKRYKESSDAATESVIKFREFEAAVRMAGATAGATGLAKITAEQREVARQVAETNVKYHEASDKLNALNASLKALDPEHKAEQFAAVTPVVTDFISSLAKHTEIQQTQTDIANATKEVNSLKAALDELTKRQSLLGIEAGPEAASQARELFSAQIDAAEKAGKARIESEKKTLEERYHLNQITLDQEIEGLKRAADEEYKLELDKLARRRALALREQAETGKPAGPALTGIKAEEVSLEESHQREISALDARAAEQRKKWAEDLAKARIEIEKSTTAAIIAGQQEATKASYAAHQISATEETRQLLDERTRQYENDRAALVKDLALVRERGGNTVADQETINGQLLALEMKFEEDKHAIRAEGDAKDLADQIARGEEQLAFTESIGNRELASAFRVDDERLRSHRITTGRWAADETRALDSWYRDQQAALTRWLALVRTVYGEGSREYQAALDKMAGLDNRYQQERSRIQEKQLSDWNRITTQMTQTLTSGVNSWIQGQKTFAASMAETWDSMVMMVVKIVEDMAAKWIAAQIMRLVTTKMTNTSAGVSEAGLAGAAGFASVMAALPFPANIAVAPEVAAAAFAGAMGFVAAGSFEKGGIAREDMVALMHPGEMTLPADISRGFQAMIRGGGAGQQITIRQHYAPVIMGEKRWSQKILRENSDYNVQLLKRAARHNKLSGVRVI